MSAAERNQAAPASPLAVRVRDAMHAGLVDCAPQTPMSEVAALMADREIHCVVVDGLARGARGAERLVWSIVSDLDLSGAVSADRLSEQAGAFAATEPLVVAGDDDLQHAAQLMAEHGCSHLVVTDEASGRPIGVLSSLDIARAVARSMRGERASGPVSRPREAGERCS